MNIYISPVITQSQVIEDIVEAINAARSGGAQYVGGTAMESAEELAMQWIVHSEPFESCETRAEMVEVIEYHLDYLCEQRALLERGIVMKIMMDYAMCTEKWRALPCDVCRVVLRRKMVIKALEECRAEGTGSLSVYASLNGTLKVATRMISGQQWFKLVDGCHPHDPTDASSPGLPETSYYLDGAQGLTMITITYKDDS